MLYMHIATGEALSPIFFLMTKNIKKHQNKYLFISNTKKIPNLQFPSLMIDCNSGDAMRVAQPIRLRTLPGDSI